MSGQPESPAQPYAMIAGVFTVALRVFGDERGRFTETFRRAWFPHINWDNMQNNRSDSVAGVLRGLHYHHHQVDYWMVAAGTIRAALVDLRPSSPTHRAATTMDIGSDHDIGLLIPEGVAHGFVALTDCTLMYIVNRYYDGGIDEHGLAWHDPALCLDWGIDAAPLLSERDLQNPLLHDITPDHLPK